MENQSNRNNSIDCIRLIAFALITTLHYMGWGEVVTKETIDLHNINFLLASGIYSLATCGTTLFFVITGYFLKEAPLKLEKLTKLWYKVVFYSFVIAVIAMASGITPFDPIMLIERLFPIITNHYWFITVFFVIMLIMPLLGYVKRLSIATHGIILLAYMVYFVAYSGDMTTVSYGIFCVLLGSFISRIGIDNIKLNVVLCLIIYVASSGILGVLRIKSPFSFIGKEYAAHQFAINPVFVVISACALFITIMKLKLKTSLFSKFSQNYIAIYLITCNHSINMFLYQDLFKCKEFFIKGLFIPNYIVVTIITIIVPVAIDVLISKLINKIPVPKFLKLKQLPQ